MLKTLLICGTVLLIAGVHFNLNNGLIITGIAMMTFACAGALTEHLCPTKK